MHLPFWRWPMLQRNVSKIIFKLTVCLIYSWVSTIRCWAGLLFSYSNSVQTTVTFPSALRFALNLEIALLWPNQNREVFSLLLIKLIYWRNSYHELYSTNNWIMNVRLIVWNFISCVCLILFSNAVWLFMRVKEYAGFFKGVIVLFWNNVQKRFLGQTKK